MTATLDSVSTIPAMLDLAASRYSDRAFIVDGGITLSFSDTAKLAEQVAAGLVSSGFEYGDRAAIWAPNCADWIVAALGILSAGGVLVTVNTRYKGAEAANIVNDSGAKVAFVIDRFLDTDYGEELSRHSTPTLEQVVSISLDSSDQAGNGLSALASSGAAWLEDGANRERFEQQRARICGESRSDILFTSGTTGRPKGVVTRHRQNLKAFATFSEILGLDEDDRYLIINPFFHSFGYKAGWLASLMRGATVYPLAVFDVPEVLARIEKHRITVMPGPPTLFQSILSHPGLEACDISSLKKATTGAAVIPTQLIVDMRETLEIDTVITAYGLSETCGLVTMCRQGDAADTIAQTSGRAIPDIEVAIVGADGNPLPAGESEKSWFAASTSWNPISITQKQPPTPSMTRVGCTQAISVASTQTVISESPIDSKTCSSRAASTAIPQKLKIRCLPTSTSRRSLWSGCPMSGWVRSEQPS